MSTPQPTDPRLDHDLRSRRRSLFPVATLVAATLAVATLVPAALPTASAAPAEAAPEDVALDVIHLVNGDRLTGTVKSLAEGELLLDAEWGGEVVIPWSAVHRLDTATTVEVVLEDGTALRGTLSSPQPGTLEVAVPELDPAPELDLGAVAALNPPERPAVELQGGVSLGLVSASGNTESESLSLQGELEARTEANRYTLGLEAYEASEDGRDTAARRTAALGYDHFLSERWYFNSNARFTEDEFRDLELRSSFGLGGGYQFWEREAAALSLELGLAHVNEDFLTSADASFSAARWALDVRQRLWPSVTFFHRQDGLLSLEDSDDLLIQTHTGLRFSLVRKLVASAQLSLDWDDSPAPGREEEDTTWLLTLGYEW